MFHLRLYGHTGVSLSKVFEVSSGSFPALFRCTKAIACVSRLLSKRERDKDRGPSDTGMPNTEAKALGSENDLSLEGFPPSRSKLMYNLRHRRLYLYGKEFQELDTGIHDNTWENSTQEGHFSDDILFDTLYKDENDRLEMNDEDRCFDLM